MVEHVVPISVCQFAYLGRVTDRHKYHRPSVQQDTFWLEKICVFIAEAYEDVAHKCACNIVYD